MAILRTTTPGSDLYLIGVDPLRGRDHVFWCVWCHLEPNPQGKFLFGCTATLTHLQRHRDAGHAVPDHAFEEIRDLFDVQ